MSIYNQQTKSQRDPSQVQKSLVLVKTKQNTQEKGVLLQQEELLNTEEQNIRLMWTAQLTPVLQANGVYLK